MNPTQLEELKQALRRQWEAEQEIARIEREILKVADNTPVVAASIASDAVQPTKAEGIAVDGKPETIAKRIMDFFKANQGRSVTTSEVVSALSSANAPSVRSALNRLVGHGIEKATDPDGTPRREHYVLSEGDS